jgi:hypothetical protein
MKQRPARENMSIGFPKGNTPYSSIQSKMIGGTCWQNPRESTKYDSRRDLQAFRFSGLWSQILDVETLPTAGLEARVGVVGARRML